MEIYIDDMLINNLISKNYIDDLEEAFTTMHKYQMKLNPMKYVFGVTSDKFLGFMASQWVVKTNLENIHVVSQMGALEMVKEAQKLIGRIAALS